MRIPARLVLLVACLAALGCGPAVSAVVLCNSDEDCETSEVCTAGACEAGAPLKPSPDAGRAPEDAGEHDSGSALVDAGEADAGAGADDGGLTGDAGALNDAGPLDAGAEDAGPPDAGLVDGCTRHATAAGDLVACEVPLQQPAAQASCESMGLTLVEVGGDAQNEAVRAIAIDLGVDVWIGLDDAEVEGVFTWLSGAPLTYEHFNGGEPNDNSPGEDCVQLFVTGRWNDTRCTSEKAYVCSAPNAPLALDEPYCLAQPALCRCETVSFDGRLYTLCGEGRRYDTTQDACEAHGMQPVKPTTTRERAFLSRQAELLSASFWVGYGDPDGDGVHHYWDGTTGSSPYSSASSGTCALAMETGAIAPRSCEEARGYACVADMPLDVAGDCTLSPSGAHLSCDTPRTAYEARAVCQRAGMDLVIIDDADENAFVRERAEEQGGQWIGVDDLREEMLFRTAANGLLAFADFERDEPNDTGGEDCVELSALSGQWNDEGCDEKRSFVCEPVVDIPPLPPPGPLCALMPSACPCEKRVKDGVFYLFCNAGATWSNARDVCGRFGMQMLEPPDVEHDAFVRGQLNAIGRFDSVWTGINDRAVEGSFVGSSGAAPPYASWAPGAPDDSGGQDCVHYRQAFENLWDDRNCSERSLIGCQVPLSPSLSCIDEDGDGHGVGCPLGPDCDDADPRRNASALDICNLIDDDCSGGVDDGPHGCACALAEDDQGAFWMCDESVTWYAARGQCRAYGGELAVPGSPDEEQHLQLSLAEHGIWRAWLGINDIAAEGSYVTVSGAPASYLRWHDTQPTGAGEDCVEWSAAGWYDAVCTTTRPYVCELP